MGDKISQLPAATSVDGTEIVPIVQGGATKKVTGLILRNPAGPASGDLTGSFPNPSLAAITTAQTAGSATQVPVVTVDAKGRVTSLSTASNPQGTVTSVVAGTGLTGGTITSTGTLAVSYGTTAGTAAQGNDSRFSTIPAASTTLPSPDGTAAIGGSATFARADHVHERQPVALTGDVSGSGTGSISTSLASITTEQTNIGSGTQIPVISVDAKGRVTSLSSVPVSAPTDAITALTGDVTATGPGSVNAALATITTAQTNIGSSTTVPIISVDAKGRVTALGSTPISGSAGGTVTSITAGAGLSGGTITDSGTIALADVTTAQTAVGNSTTIPVITVNAKGQITALTTAAAAGGVALATTAPANLASTAAVGTGTTAARADHQHAFPTAAQVGALEAAAVAGGDLTGNYPNPELTAITTAQSNIGSSSTIPVISVDAKGRVTALSSVALSVPYAIEVLLVAGGGSGGSAGGGGGGGVIFDTTINALSGQSYPIIIGAGGAGGAGAAFIANNGQNTTAFSLTAIGGGGGGRWSTASNNQDGFAGGSGGGAGLNSLGTTNTGGAGTSGQGFAGGNANQSYTTGYTAAGGGGGGAVGGNKNNQSAGAGRIGFVSAINGTSLYWAGGGGGGGNISPSIAGNGGLGGGGGGANANNGTAGTGGGSALNVGGNGVAGTGASGTGGSGGANTGGGGGGQAVAIGTSGSGGSGIVILRYLGTQRGAGGTVTSAGGYTIHTFTSSGAYIA